ncbi:MAG: class I SAM-dependent methyltransferase [Anaerolineaceae bacterium]
MADSWKNGKAYNQFMGRWSKRVSVEFLSWFLAPMGQTWLDIGCGTGNLTRGILNTSQPANILSIDSSLAFIIHAKKSIADPLVNFSVCYAQNLSLRSKSMDAVVSGLVLNFVPQPEEAIAEMVRVSKQGGKIGAFVWDYSDGMQFLRYFWDAAIAVDPDAVAYDEGSRFPVCQVGQLARMFQVAGIRQIVAKAIEIKTEFKNFDDYWQPFLSNVGAAPNYISRLGKNKIQKLEAYLRNSLPTHPNGSISLLARAWAVKGIV